MLEGVQARNACFFSGKMMTKLDCEGVYNQRCQGLNTALSSMVLNMQERNVLELLLVYLQQSRGQFNQHFVTRKKILNS